MRDDARQDGSASSPCINMVYHTRFPMDGVMGTTPEPGKTGECAIINDGSDDGQLNDNDGDNNADTPKGSDMLGDALRRALNNEGLSMASIVYCSLPITKSLGISRPRSTPLGKFPEEGVSAAAPMQVPRSVASWHYRSSRVPRALRSWKGTRGGTSALSEFGPATRTTTSRAHGLWRYTRRIAP